MVTRKYYQIYECPEYRQAQFIDGEPDAPIEIIKTWVAWPNRGAAQKYALQFQ